MGFGQAKGRGGQAAGRSVGGGRQRRSGGEATAGVRLCESEIAEEVPKREARATT